MQQKRVFWAINLPDELKRKLFGLQSRLREIPADVKWVEQQNFHLTVKFLGDVSVVRIGEIIDTVGQAVSGTGSFDLEIAGVGFFPGAKRPRIIWAGVGGEVHVLRALHERVEESLTRFGFADDLARFSPHLTLGRLRSPQGSSELVEKAALTDPEFGVVGRFKVNQLELMESNLTRRGAIYKVVAGINL